MRSIETEMIRFLDAKLASNGLAQEAIREGDARQLLISAAEACVGIREKGGNNKGPLVELMQKTIGGANQEAWCMSFVQTLIAYVEVKLIARSPVLATEHCMTCWRGTPTSERVKLFPARGAIVIWRHGSSDAGHTGVFIERTGVSSMLCIEGNTEAGLENGSIVREGGGVYLTNRSTIANGNMRVVGWLKPFPIKSTSRDLSSL